MRNRRTHFLPISAAQHNQFVDHSQDSEKHEYIDAAGEQEIQSIHQWDDKLRPNLRALFDEQNVDNAVDQAGKTRRKEIHQLQIGGKRHGNDNGNGCFHTGQQKHNNKFLET